MEGDLGCIAPPLGEPVFVAERKAMREDFALAIGPRFELSLVLEFAPVRPASPRGTA
jgi:hypothetical protein